MAEESRRVLVVDDEESVRAFLQRMLKDAGYEVTTAANGQEALDKLVQSRIGVVLMDINMPKMSGMEALRQITANWPDTCVVMATAVGDVQTAVEAMKLGAYDYITKPFNREGLVLTLQKAIAKRDLQLESERRRLDLEKRVGEHAERLQQTFRELVETLAREHALLYRLADKEPKKGKALLSKLPPELQKPMSSAEEFSEALLRILKRGITKPGP